MSTLKSLMVAVALVGVVLGAIVLSTRISMKSPAPAVSENLTALSPGATPGLKAQFLNRKDPLGPTDKIPARDVLPQRVDAQINFDWSEKPAFINGPMIFYMVMWTGKVLADKDGEYRFIVNSDDGSQLWIGNKLLIDDWNLHGAEDRSATIKLTKGWHPIRLHYLQLTGKASVRLSWTTPDGKSGIIPATHFSH